MNDNHDKIEKVASALAAVWRDGGVLPVMAEEWLPVDMTEAFAMQDALHGKLGYEMVGWKLGITSSAGQKATGIPHPMIGRLYRHVVQNDPGRFPASDFRRPVIEGEITLRLGKALPAREIPYTDDDVRDALSEIIMGIDIADTRWDANPMTGEVSPIVVAADNGGMGGFVVGAVIPDWQNIDLAALPVQVEVDGVPAGELWTGDARGDPISAVCWAANELSRRGLGFQAGDIVSTGSAHEPVPATLGAETIVRFSKSEVRVTLERV